MAQLSFHSPLGDLTVTEEDDRLISLDWGRAPVEFQSETPLLLETRQQVAAYFTGRLQDFDLPLSPSGTAFQQRVWQAMCDIPYGATATYGVLAGRLGSAARAVGGACGANRIPIVIPCHRVLAAGHLGGYSGDGGLDTKRALLRLETAYATPR